MDKQLEQRFIEAEVRLFEEENKPKIRGQIPFDSLSVNLGGFKERIRKGAFKRSLVEGRDIRALFNHSTDKPLARTSTGTLLLTETDNGLDIEITPNNASWSKDVQETIRSGDLNGFSFGFFVTEDEWDNEGGQVVRELIDLDLVEVSPVFQPAYKASEIAVRIAPDAIEAAKRYADQDAVEANLDAIEERKPEPNNSYEIELKRKQLDLLKLKLSM
ncbi:HK97 family phage prohead protease [Rubinisphaera italica]|uniref:Caudovirus prohead protease n=1 Tax=Rubinisphaera italica TaxID=2527969 RepID=A0A5C5XM16_9PLAN|nr:HK97 family phage prohead protease [Rubinisphaera italica]TWT64246.1 Caudovirus prohead protease [Rubinisphaera italica]